MSWYSHILSALDIERQLLCNKVWELISTIVWSLVLFLWVQF